MRDVEKTELLPHQVDAVNKLKKLKVGALFMEQGTGKSLVAIELFKLRYLNGKADRAIWLCPCSAKDNIKQQIIKHAPEYLLDRFVICGIETLSSSIRANVYLLKKVDKEKCFLIVDESLLVKNPKAIRTKSVIRLSEKSTYRIILNGTPISRNEADLYSQFYILDWRILGYKSYWSFEANHLEYDEYGNVRRALNTDYLARKMEPYTFQVRKKDCLKLPPKIYEDEYIFMTDRQTEYYDRIADKLLLEIDEYQPETIYRLFAAMQAVVSGKYLEFTKDQRGEEHFTIGKDIFKNHLDNPRLKKLLEILPDDKCIIFCNFKHEIDVLMEVLGEDAIRFDGLISVKNRNKNLIKFQKEKKYLVANRACAGYSLNLQFCKNIIYYSNNWNLATRLQSEDRVHRLGQQATVSITDIIANNSLDARIFDSIQRKENLMESIKEEIQKASNVNDKVSEFLYVGRYKKRVKIIDMDDLKEEVHAQNIYRQECV